MTFLWIVCHSFVCGSDVEIDSETSQIFIFNISLLEFPNICYKLICVFINHYYFIG